MLHCWPTIAAGDHIRVFAAQVRIPGILPGEADPLSILKLTANPDHVEEIIRAMLAWVNEDTAYQNAKLYPDRQNAESEFETALLKQVTESLRYGTEFHKKFTEDPDF